MREWALAYASNGIPVIPLHNVEPDGTCSCMGTPAENPKCVVEQKNRGKHPRSGGWQKVTLPDLKQVHEWWTRWPNANIGAVCGTVFDVLDVDGEEGRAVLAEMVDYNEPLPEGPVVKTGSGGEHRYFRPFAPKNSVSKVGKNLDVRTTGGQVVLPPSSNGNGTYEVVSPFTLPLPEAPAFLKRAAQAAASSTDGPRAAEPVEKHKITPNMDRNDIMTRFIWKARQSQPHLSGKELVALAWAHVTDPDSYADPEDLKRDPPNRAEIEDMVRRAMAKKVEPRQERERKKATAVTDLPPCLPDAFWTARPYLMHIRQAAWSRRLPPDLLLGVSLARQAAMVEHTIGLPATVGADSSSSVYFVPVAKSGGGKSTSLRTASHLLPDDSLIVLPGGSGEGLVEAFFSFEEEEFIGKDGKTKKRKVKRQVHHNLLAVVDEGQAAMQRESRNAGSTLFARLREMWTGGVAGEGNSAVEKKRVLKDGSYSIGVVLGFQPELIGALLSDTASGTAQRFVYLSAHAELPKVAPPWPGELLPKVMELLDAKQTHKVEDLFGFQKGSYVYWFTVAEPVCDEIIAAHDARTRGAGSDDPFDSHRNLNRLKVAGLLGIWDGRLDVTEDDWRLAGMVIDTSDGVREWAQRVVAATETATETASAQRQGRRVVESEKVVEADRRERCRDAIKRALGKENGQSRSDVRRAVRVDLRPYFDDALDDLVEKSLVEQRTEPGQGLDKVTLWLR